MPKPFTSVRGDGQPFQVVMGAKHGQLEDAEVKSDSIV